MATSSVPDSTVSRPSSGVVSPPRHMRSRTQSISSDRPSTIGHNLMSPPLSVSPEAAFIAASAASQIVTNDHDSHADAWYDQHGIEPAGETALVSTSALQLVNNFLDQLLFNFLSVARTTTLAALRPAVSEVLKPKLAKDAVNQADEELREYLGGGDEDDFVHPHGADPTRDWDLELVWKRTRLRCMVYSSLGDMEEEDEDYYMEQEDLEPGADDHLSEVISPAVAIFLTSILEFMGEQALVVAGQAAYHRMRAKYEKELKDGARSPADIADRIVVEELDMERVALDRTLGRLWRAWKKRIRSPTTETGVRPFSRDSMRGLNHFRQSSLSENPMPVRKPTEADGAVETEEAAEENEAGSPVEEWIKASAIPLPMGDHDVDEIEVPGLTQYSDDEDDTEEEDEDELLPQRPKSLVIFPHELPSIGLLSPAATPTEATVFPSRKRSNSLPTPGASLFGMPTKRPKVDQSKAADDTSAEYESARELAAEETAEDDASLASTAAETPVVPSTDKMDDLDETPRRQAHRPAKIITSAGIAAIDRVKAARPGTLGRDAQNIEDYEPEILTSSRVSIGGRSSPSISSDSGKPFGVQRSASVHSARIIEVVNPKSPRSRTSSVDTLERQRPASLSQSSAVSTPRINEEPFNQQEVEAVRRGGAASPVIRSPVIRAGVRGANQSISEVEEDAEVLSARGESTPTTATLSTPTSAMLPPEELQSQIKQSHAIFGSVLRHHEPTSPSTPRSPSEPTSPMSPKSSIQEQPSSPGTKVTILNSSGAFSDGRPEPPSKSPTKSRSGAVAIPERSANRQVNGSQSPVASIGVVSIERNSGRRDSPEPRDDYSSPIAGSSATPRQIHTSGSSGSSGQGTKLKAVRTSEESGSKASVARTFEELIQSDQTIQYTLTPEGMRDIDASRSLHNSSPVMPAKARKSEDARTANDRSRSSSGATDIKRTPSITMATGLNSHPIPREISTSKLNGPVPKAPTANGASRAKVNVPQARDARVPRESVMDFADFIRSTGPPGDNGPAPLRNFSGPIPSSRGYGDSRRVSANATRPRLQARDASTDAREDSSDLIDFIRRGPPSGPNNPRIPRTVAPFRTTMDSDQMSGAGGGRAVDAVVPSVRYSQASTSVTEASFTSQSALLRNNAPYQNGNAFDDEDMMPKRKTRRVKDPYAIDFSDDDEEDMPGPSKPPAKEESLAEFLKNYAPPPEPASPVNYEPQSRPKKKASAPSLMGRFGRGSSASASAPQVNGYGSNSPDPRPVSSRNSSGRGYIPIQVNMPPGYDKYGPVDPVASRPPPVASASTGRVPMKKFEPREAVSTSSRTSDLADFLRNSEPPASMSGPSGQYSPTFAEESPGVSKMFARRKKSGYA